MEQDKDKITFKEYYHENGQLRYKHQFLNGKLHGEQLDYFDNGLLMYKNQFLNGNRHGEQLSYYSNGQLMYKNYYINGEWTSYEEWMKYNRNLKLNSIWNKIK